jgi:glutamate/tyrosine decarboxylase-like PLP-dependent enzyme
VLQSHYSIKGAAAVTGIGVDNCFVIETDAAGRMIPEALEAKIIETKRDGLHPFFVCATAGTTVYGAFDPLPLIADICDRHELWMHVDVSVRVYACAHTHVQAAWGGGLLLSTRHRHLHTGIERAHSVTWNPHKLMGASLQCSACFVRREVGLALGWP